MDLILCHHCLAWVSAGEGPCGVCGDWIDLTDPDPDPEDLDRRVGEWVADLGEVTLNRKALPDCGVLVLTREGFLFLPHRVQSYEQVFYERSRSTSILWTAASFLYAPLLLLSYAFSQKQARTRLVESYTPRVVTPPERTELGRLLMESPGGWFLERKRVRGVQLRRSKCKLVPRSGGAVICRPKQARAFRESITDPYASAPWCYDLIEF